MIVAKCFDGDHDMATALKQHDVYGHALGILVQTCNRLTGFAKALLDDKAHPDWGLIETFDHRCLQVRWSRLAGQVLRLNKLFPRLVMPPV